MFTWFRNWNVDFHLESRRALTVPYITIPLPSVVDQKLFSTGTDPEETLQRVSADLTLICFATDVNSDMKLNNLSPFPFLPFLLLSLHSLLLILVSQYIFSSLSPFYPTLSFTSASSLSHFFKSPASVSSIKSHFCRSFFSSYSVSCTIIFLFTILLPLPVSTGTIS